jgi:hypothetical protein
MTTFSVILPFHKSSPLTLIGYKLLRNMTEIVAKPAIKFFARYGSPRFINCVYKSLSYSRLIHSIHLYPTEDIFQHCHVVWSVSIHEGLANCIY